MKDEVRVNGERIDRLAKRLYGSEQGGTVEALLSANPGLAQDGPELPAGRPIEVPAEVVNTRPSPYQLGWE